MYSKKMLSLLLAGSMIFSFSGCEKELGSDKTQIDVLDSQDFDENELYNGITQEKEVNGEDFKLVIEYIAPEDAIWRINDTKHLYISIKTLGLKSGLEVYIDNIHMDTSIVCANGVYDGILQDSMDDRIHNSLMLGFPISDEVSYFGCNVIEGQNSEFIEGYAYGSAGYITGDVITQRRLESDYLEEGVNANKIDSVIDLIVVDKNNNTTRAVSVFSSLKVKANNLITYLNGDTYTVYKYNDGGSKTKVFEGTEEQYRLTFKKK